MSVSLTGVSVTIDSASAVRTICPPPAPPSISSIDRMHT
jgi:hypothetical protein